MGFEDEKSSHDTTFVHKDGHALDMEFELQRWRTKVSDTLDELEDRIAALERKKSNFIRRSVERHIRKRPIMVDQGSSYTTYGTYGLDGIPTCIHLILTKRVALLQCIWLILCMFMFFSVGITQFIRAKANEESEYKPEKISYIIDYASGDVTLQYEMPNVYVFFEVSLTNESYPLTLRDTSTILENMLVSQNYFNNSVGFTYLTTELEAVQSSASCEEANSFFLSWTSDNSFFAYFQIRLSNPDPEMGSFWFWLLMKTEELALDKTLDIIGFWVYVGRDTSKLSLTNLAYVAADEAFNDNVTLSYTLDYTESIHSEWNNPKQTYRFDTEIAWARYSADEWVQNYGIYMTFRGNERIEIWEEYVGGFTYYDWIFGLGGMLNLSTVIFFFVAYHTATLIGDTDTLGILPGMSKVFRNLEMLSLIKKQLVQKKILFEKEFYEKNINMRSLQSRITDFELTAV